MVPRDSSACCAWFGTGRQVWGTGRQVCVCVCAAAGRGGRRPTHLKRTRALVTTGYCSYCLGSWVFTRTVPCSPTSLGSTRRVACLVLVLLFLFWLAILDYRSALATSHGSHSSSRACCCCSSTGGNGHGRCIWVVVLGSSLAKGSPPGITCVVVVVVDEGECGGTEVLGSCRRRCSYSGYKIVLVGFGSDTIQTVWFSSMRVREIVS